VEEMKSPSEEVDEGAAVGIKSCNNNGLDASQNSELFDDDDEIDDELLLVHPCCYESYDTQCHWNACINIMIYLSKTN